MPNPARAPLPIVITLIGEEGAMELDINDDGSLQSPMFGELVKKAKSAA